MLTKSSIIANQQKHGVDNIDIQDINSTDAMEYAEYKNKCREYVIKKTEELPDYFNKSDYGRRSIDESLITDFVYEKTNVPVKGYYFRGVRNTNELIKDLVQDLTLYGVLTPLMNDESIGEIQINDLNAIFYESQKDGKGEFVRYVDANGKPKSFQSEEEMLTILTKLISNRSGDTRITPDNALVNARTPQGYRIAIADKDVFPPAPPPNDSRSYTAVIRKVKKTKLTMHKLIEYKTLTVGMARFIQLIASAENKIFVAGSTGSGKTVTLDVMLHELSEGTDIRTLVVQNPTEIDNRIRDENGAITNNTVLWEAKDDPKDKVKDAYPTLQNLNSHSLRFTPQLILVGEVRKPNEFSELLRIMMTGHIAWSSFHADTPFQAVKRFANEVATGTGMVVEMAMDQVCDALDFIISQKKLKDGTRKITSISEIVGYDPIKKSPIINEIYKFVPDGKNTIKQGKTVLKVAGEHKRCGVISKAMADKLYLAGITYDELKPYLDEGYENEEISYDWTTLEG